MIQTKGIYKIILEVGVHLFFWVSVYFFYTFFLGYGSTNTGYINTFSFFLMPVTIVGGYLYKYYLIPQYLLQKKYKTFVLYSVYSIVLSSSVIVFSVFYGLLFTVEKSFESVSPITKSLPFIVLGVFFVILIIISISLIRYNYQSILKNEDIHSKFLQTQLQLKEQELKFLKMQIHPHFLFNTLNTMYGLALKKAEETPDVILKLSSLLDYILYQIDKPWVLLSEEINHVKDYVALEKIRFQEKLKVTFNIENEEQDIKVVPMLFIPFVENAFKHGRALNGCLHVIIQLNVTKELIHFRIENTVGESTSFGNGIGLTNIKKRLAILYPDNHVLKINRAAKNFEVILEINRE